MSSIEANFTNKEIENLLKHKTIAEKFNGDSPIISISPDKDILGATVGQAYLMLLGIANLSPQLNDAVFLKCNAVAIKLCALRYHRKKYEELQKRRSAEISADLNISALIQNGLKICELEMLYEVEAFFHQYKSALVFEKP